MSALDTFELPTTADQAAALAAVLQANAQSHARAPDPADPSASARYAHAAQLVAQAALTLYPEEDETPAGA